ncbi:putative AT-rich interactive domain-containing protein 2 [Cocos nucifera]|uniref:Putative AT-rich interactive domain-containing protein 2 n=1 Tax=Cocos nucifera TaxID=13894 RepID=A0A8K0MZM0_COCNU|nr:putative AT-rich interactive domain-containing protein 2 [Cocos nucifera]
MAGLSFYLDGVPLDSPLLNPCNGASLSPDFADPEAELRLLFDQISATLARDSWPESPGFESLRSDLVERWVQRFLGEGGEGSPCDRRFSLCPDLRRRIEALIRERLSERMDRSKEAGSLGLSPGSSGSRKRKRYLEDMLIQVRAFAVEPRGGTTGGSGGGGGGGEGGGEEWGKQVLDARRTLYLSTAEFANIEDFPSYPQF